MRPNPVDLLRAGKCTGALTFLGADGVRKLQVRRGTRGRGLFAVHAFKKGDLITYVSGAVVSSSVSSNPGQEVFKWSKTNNFVMDYAAMGAGSGLGILFNTAGGTGENNAKYRCNRTENVLRISAIRNIAPGEEILAAYGRSYVSKINNAVQKETAIQLQHMNHVDNVAPVVWCKGAVARMLCAKCRKALTSANRLTHARFCKPRIDNLDE